MVLQMENVSFRSHIEACSLLLRTNQSNLYFSTAQHVDSLNPKCPASIFQSLHSRKQHTKWPQCFPSSFKTFNESFITYKEQKSILTWNIGRPAWPFSFQIFLICLLCDLYYYWWTVSFFLCLTESLHANVHFLKLNVKAGLRNI